MTYQAYSIDYGGSAPRQGESGAPPAQLPVPGYPYPYPAMPPQKKRLPASVSMFLGMLLCGSAMYGAEMYAPDAYKPSTVTGAYSGRYAAEIKAHDLETQAKFQDWAQQVQLSVTQQQEQYRAAAQSVVANYQATYDRTKIFASATAQLQQAYMAQRMDIVRANQGGDVAVVNFARLFGRLAGIVDPQAGQAALNYADDISGQLQNELDDAVSSGVTVNVDGWDTSLATPDQVRAQMSAIPVVTFPALPRISRDALAEGK